MAYTVYNSPAELGQAAAREIVALVRQKPDALLCMAGGETPRLTYQQIVILAAQQQVDFSRVHFVSLDEWVGISRLNPGSCYYFLEEHLFSPLAIPQPHIHFFDAGAKDFTAACAAIDRFIEERGGIDCMLVGVGMNGHIGFNEPGTAATLLSHVIELDPVTTQVGQKYFTEDTPLHKGITLGMAHVLQSRRVIMQATGHKKAAIIARALKEEVSAAVPASLVRTHPHAWIMLDSAAASLLD
jgi:glucosamine-6-phosphate isomerase